MPPKRGDQGHGTPGHGRGGGGFTNEMRKVFKAFTDNLEVRAVFAESIMNETPWLMWDLRLGQAGLFVRH